MSVNSKKLSSLFEGLGVVYQRLNGGHQPLILPINELDPMIEEVTLDIEEVRAGVLFIARQLWYTDTHEYVSEAIERGASAVIVSRRDIIVTCASIDLSRVPIVWVEHEDPTLGLLCDRFYDHPTASLKVYGVTGTNGKTSAVSYLAELLTAVDERVAVMGTVEYRFEEQVLIAPNTTPDALVIQRFARQALNLGATALALEVSSHALSLDRVAGIRFDVVGFTSFGRDHLDFHGSLEEYRKAKGRLFDDYLAYAIDQGKHPVAVAHQEPEGLAMLKRAPSEVSRVYCQAMSDTTTHQPIGPKECYLRLNAASSPSLTGLALTAQVKTSTTVNEFSEVFAPLIGDYHPLNVGIALGMIAGTHPHRLNDAWRSLASTKGVAGRMERVTLPYQHETDRRVALVDYAHTPDAITRAIEAIRSVHDGTVSVIVGCGGDRDRGKRPKMLQSALNLADQVWLTSDNPRGEVPLQIIKDALSLNLSDGSSQLCNIEVDRRQCILKAWQELPAGGALLITGKGHESYQEVNQRRYRLRDQEAVSVANCVEWLGYRTLEEVPFCESVLELRDRQQSFTTHQQDLVSLLREAGLRRGGLSICLSYQALETIELSAIPLDIQADTLVCYLVDLSTECLTSQIWFASQRLAPKHRILKLILSSEERCSQLRDHVQTILSKVTHHHPKPEIPLLVGDKCYRDHIKGGWSHLEVGDKIPRLQS